MTNKRCYFGNIPYSATRIDIETFFQGFELTDVKICTDRDTGRARGFAFVEFKTEEQAKSAIENLSGMDFGGRSIVINEARDRMNARDSRPRPRI